MTVAVTRFRKEARSRNEVFWASNQHKRQGNVHLGLLSAPIKTVIRLYCDCPRKQLYIYGGGIAIHHATGELLKRRVFLGKPLTDYSPETVGMFHEDSAKSDFSPAGTIRYV
jgi:hypothetical protein